VSQAVRRGPGRRPGTADTRAEILAAARAEFAANGFDGTTIRGVARVADVDPALIHHYFSTKHKLFIEAVGFPIDPTEVLPGLIAGAPPDAVERLLRYMFSVWEDPQGRERVLAMVKSAVTTEQVAGMLRDYVLAQVIVPMLVEAGLVKGDRAEAERRVGFALSQVLGMVVGRYVIRIESLAEADPEELIAEVAPTLRRYLSE